MRRASSSGVAFSRGCVGSRRDRGSTAPRRRSGSTAARGVLALVFLPGKRLVDIGDAVHRRLLVADPGDVVWLRDVPPLDGRRGDVERRPARVHDHADAARLCSSRAASSWWSSGPTGSRCWPRLPGKPPRAAPRGPRAAASTGVRQTLLPGALGADPAAPDFAEDLAILAHFAMAANDTMTENERRIAEEPGVWVDSPERRADPRLRVDLPDDQRGRGRARHRRARRQGRGARRHRLQVRRGHPGRRAVDPPLGQPGRRGLARRRDRRARPHEGGRRGAADPLEEARPLRARLEEHRARGRVGRARERPRDRGRQGRPDPRPRRARLPAGVARRHPPRPGPGRVPRQGAALQGDRAQPLAQQRRALAPRRARGGAQGAAPADPRPAAAGQRRRGPDLEHRRLRRLRRPRRHGRPDPHLGALVEPRQPPVRGARDRPDRQGQGARHRPRPAADLARPQADAVAIRGSRCSRATRRATSSRAA